MTGAQWMRSREHDRWDLVNMVDANGSERSVLIGCYLLLSFGDPVPAREGPSLRTQSIYLSCNCRIA